jgi:hypothetical protein
MDFLASSICGPLRFTYTLNKAAMSLMILTAKNPEYSDSPVPGPIGPPQIPRRLVWDRNVIYAMKGHGITP